MNGWKNKMTTEQFTFWLQGFFEISDTKELTEKQVQIVKDHLNLVLKKVTPERTGPAYPPPKEGVPGTIRGQILPTNSDFSTRDTIYCSDKK